MPEHTDYMRWLNKISYKRGYEMTLIPAGIERGSVPYVEFSCLVEDSRSEDPLAGHIRITLQRAIWPLVVTTEEEFQDFIFEGWKRFEIHEMQEWLRVDGELYRDPHLNT